MASFKNYVPAVLWTGVIFIFSMEAFRDGVTFGALHSLFAFFGQSTPHAELDEINYMVRKTAHFSVYAVLAALWLRAFKVSGKSLPSALLWTFIFSLSCAALDEFHQSFEPVRTALVSDVFIDASGAAAALLFLTVKLKKRRAAAAGPGG